MADRPRRLKVHPSVYKALERLDQPQRTRVKEEILALVENPYPEGKGVKGLKGPAGDLLRLRVGNYRVMYRVTREEVYIAGLVHRRDLDRWIKRL